MAHDPQDTAATPMAEDPALGSLEARLAAAQKAETERLAAAHAPLAGSASAAGRQIASTMLGYPLGGIVIGFVLDSVFDTKPWITIGLMFAAFFAACFQVVRSNKGRTDPGAGGRQE